MTKAKIEYTHKEFTPKLVFVQSENNKTATAKKRQVFQDEMTRISKLIGNEHITINKRISMLNEMADTYANFKPFANNEILKAINHDGVPVLQRFCLSAAAQLLSIEKARANEKSDEGKQNL